MSEIIMDFELETSWQKVLEPEFEKAYYADLARAISLAYQNRVVFPKQKDLFKAFSLCPFAKVKVVILGQDPYHAVGQAHGLAFSVADETKIPPSLKNIYKELQSDLGVKLPTTGNLTPWAKQGVLLLNSTLTVEEGQAGFHQGWGWENFTDEVIRQISDQKENVVFILWGKSAQAKADFIDQTKHLILESAHPSPLSAHRGFFGSRPFSQTNYYLKRHHLKPIDWSLE